MKSRITIEVDFQNNNEAVIRLELHKDSQDVRDRLLKNFVENFGYVSSWATIAFMEVPNEPVLMGVIRPIRPNEMKEQADIMIEQCSLHKND